MPKYGIPVICLSRRLRFILQYRHSQCNVSHERYFSSKDSGNDDQNSKQNDALQNKDTPKSTSSEREKSKKTKETKEAAKKKLFSLLSEMTVVSNDKSRPRSNLKLAKAVKRMPKEERFKEELQQRMEQQKQKSPEMQMQKAAEAAASSVKGDPQQTLQELNEKLRKLNLAMNTELPPEDSKQDYVKPESTLSQLNLDVRDNMMSSVKEIADSVTGSSPPLKSKLAQRLFKLSVEGQSTDTPTPIDELIKGMKIETTQKKMDSETKEPQRRKSYQSSKEEEMRRPYQERRRDFERADLQRRMPRPSISMKPKMNIFDAAPLDIFTVQEQTSVADAKKTVWQSLEEKKLKLLTQYAPANGFEEMIMWTEQGKHWKFPINNQTEMGEEENVGFHEHVFLEQHLHGFPTKGPVRHFMELVTVGLSKNPYISVERKIENINWFRDYFKEKEGILQATGSLG